MGLAEHPMLVTEYLLGPVHNIHYGKQYIVSCELWNLKSQDNRICMILRARLDETEICVCDHRLCPHGGHVYQCLLMMASFQERATCLHVLLVSFPITSGQPLLKRGQWTH